MVGELAMRAVRSARRYHRVRSPAFLAESLFDHVRHQPVHPAAEREHFLDQAGADVGVLLRRHHENRFDLTIQPPVHQRHLKLELEVGHRAQAAHDHLGAAALDVVDQQAVEGVDFDVREVLEHLARDLDPLVHAEERRLLGVHQNRDDDAVERRAPRVMMSTCPLVSGSKDPGIDG